MCFFSEENTVPKQDTTILEDDDGEELIPYCCLQHLNLVGLNSKLQGMLDEEDNDFVVQRVKDYI